MKTKNIQLTAVIGYPLTHSQSPFLHEVLYTEFNIHAVMLPFAHKSIEKLITSIRTLEIPLTAVTMPFKQTSMPFIDSLDPMAKKVGSINTVINRGGKLHGYNTDVFGIEYALRNTIIKNKRVLIIGSGGAARAVAFVVKKNHGMCLFANRTQSKAHALQKEFGGKTVHMSQIRSCDVDIIVNATPLGMHPNTRISPITSKLIDSHHTVFDLVYNPLDTELLKRAKQKKAHIISGLDMFIAQGIRQEELWTRKKILSEKLVEKIKKKLIKKIHEPHHN